MAGERQQQHDHQRHHNRDTEQSEQKAQEHRPTRLNSGSAVSAMRMRIKFIAMPPPSELCIQPAADQT